MSHTYSSSRVSQSEIACHLGLHEPIYLSTDDAACNHIYSLNGTFFLHSGSYIAWGENHTTSEKALHTKKFENQHTQPLHLTDNEYDLVRAYLLKHAEVALYLSIGTFPKRLWGPGQREQRKTFKKLVIIEFLQLCLALFHTSLLSVQKILIG